MLYLLNNNTMKMKSKLQQFKINKQICSTKAILLLAIVAFTNQFINLNWSYHLVVF